MAQVKWAICLLTTAFIAVGCARDRAATDDGPSSISGSDSPARRLSGQKSDGQKSRSYGGYEFVEPPPVPPALGVSFRSRTTDWIKTAVGRPLSISGSGYQELPEGEDEIQYPTPAADPEFDNAVGADPGVAGSRCMPDRAYDPGVRYAPRQQSIGCADNGPGAAGCGDAGCGERASSLFDVIRSRKRPSVLKKLFSFGKHNDTYDQGCATADGCAAACSTQGGAADRRVVASGPQERGPSQDTAGAQPVRSEPVVTPRIDNAAGRVDTAVIAPGDDWDSILEDLNQMRSETTSPMADEEFPITTDTNVFADIEKELNPYAEAQIARPLREEVTPSFGPLDSEFSETAVQRAQPRSLQQSQVPSARQPEAARVPTIWREPRRMPLNEPPVYHGDHRSIPDADGYVEPPMWNRRSRATQIPLPEPGDSVERTQSTSTSVMRNASHRSGTTPVPATNGALKISPGNQVDFIR